MDSYEALEGQVGGHKDSFLVSSSGAVVVKPGLPAELAFYQDVGRALDSTLIGRWTPKTYGTLRLEGQVKPGREASTAIHPQVLQAGPGSVSRALDLELPSQEQAKEAIVLENLTYPFLRPNIVDIKLGSQLWDESASLEKRARMEKTSANTTSGSMGMRITGFRVWNPSSSSFQVTSKEFGKSLTPKHLPDGMRRVFPVCTERGPGLPAELLKSTLSMISDRISRLRSAVAGYEWRVRGGSVLIVYEGDVEQLRKSMTSEIAGLSDGEEEDDDLSDEEEEEEDEDGDGLPARTRVFDVRLIDFAHTHVCPGQGPDEGYNLGLANVERLLRERMNEI